MAFTTVELISIVFWALAFWVLAFGPIVLICATRSFRRGASGTARRAWGALSALWVLGLWALCLGLVLLAHIQAGPWR